MVENELFEIPWDRGKRTAEEVAEKNFYKFQCDACGDAHIDVEPIGVPWLHDVDNSDLPTYVRKTLVANALRLDRAVIAAQQIRVTCTKCSHVAKYNKDKIREDFARKWYVNIIKKGVVMDLKLEDEENDG